MVKLRVGCDVNIKVISGADACFVDNQTDRPLAAAIQIGKVLPAVAVERSLSFRAIALLE